MAFFFAAFGQFEPAQWAGLVRDLTVEGCSHHLAWQDSAVPVRLGTLGTKGSPSSVLQDADDLVVAAVGHVEGEESSAGAILRAYRDAGVDGLAQLPGDYAYAVWDRRARWLLVGCDAVGLRSPAYTWNGRTFLLSSRAVALLPYSGARSTFDSTYLAHALSGLWSRPTSGTAFAGIHRLKGGDAIRISERGLERLAGGGLTFRARGLNDTESALRELGEALDQAVADRAQPGPCCVALSGGIDSSVVATALAKQKPELDAFSLVSPEGFPGDAKGLAPLLSAFPGMRHRSVVLTGDDFDPPATGLIPDDPICAGPVLQAGRVALLRGVRAAGFHRMFDGEGGDELFDIAWRPGDLVREGALRRLLPALRSRARAKRLLRDFIAGARGPAALILLERMRERARTRRPWLRPKFWSGPSFASAWDEAIAFGRTQRASERMPEILGAHGRYWRTQELARIAVGVRGSSPLLDRRIVELVGSVHACVAVDLRHSKALLRGLASQRLPASIARRPKQEPLSDWLIERWVAQDANVIRMIAQIKDSAILSEHIDSAAVLAAVDQARRIATPNWLSLSLVELNAIVGWVRAVETRYGF